MFLRSICKRASDLPGYYDPTSRFHGSKNLKLDCFALLSSWHGIIDLPFESRANLTQDLVESYVSVSMADCYHVETPFRQPVAKQG